LGKGDEKRVTKNGGRVEGRLLWLKTKKRLAMTPQAQGKNEGSVIPRLDERKKHYFLI